jgi:hypothetical protein
MGTYVKPGTPITADEQSMMKMFRQAIVKWPYGLTVRQMSSYIFSVSPRPMRESGKDWNAHYTQAELSRLVGRGLLKARRMERGNALLYSLPIVVSSQQPSTP